jgi:hypothetical protein
MPDLHLITTMFDNQRYNDIKERIKDSKYGFSFNTLFSLSNDKNSFLYESEVKIFLRYISGSYKDSDFKNGDLSTFSRIKNLVITNQTRKPFTQIWFLPPNNINEISQNLKKLMMQDNILKRYNILCINRKNKDLIKDIKLQINKEEIIAQNQGQEGLIILAGSMLTLGITLNLCDVVILLNDTLSSDKYFQQIFRCMTESSNKKMGFVCDFNISRVLNTLINYTISNNNLNTEDKIKYLIENHLINIDVDIMKQKNMSSDIVINKIMTAWKQDPINNFKTLLKNIDDDFIDTFFQKIE